MTINSNMSSRGSGGQADLGVSIVVRSGSRINTMGVIHEVDNNSRSGGKARDTRKEADTGDNAELIMANRQSLANGVTVSTAGSKPSHTAVGQQMQQRNQIVNASAELSNGALTAVGDRQQPVKTKRNLTFTSTTEAVLRKKPTSLPR